MRQRATWSSLNQWSNAELIAAYMHMATGERDKITIAAMGMITTHLGDDFQEAQNEIEAIVSTIKQYARMNERNS